MKELYGLLGIPRTATADEIKKAYRKLAKALHPDTHPGNKEIELRFKEVTAAYNILSDKTQRARYDRGEIDADGNERAPAGFGGGYGTRQGAGAYTRAPQGFGFEDLFSSIFTGGAQSTRGQDQHYTLKVSFMEASKGVRKQITLGNGKTLNLTIPAGTKDQQVLRLKGQGDQNPMGGKPGDIHIKILVDTHPYLKSQGDDVSIEVPISLWEAVHGGTVTIPTLNGLVSLTIPAGANKGHPLRMKGKGPLNSRTNKPGDMFVVFKIVLPDPIDPHLKSLIETWSRQHPYDCRKEFNKFL